MFTWSFQNGPYLLTIYVRYTDRRMYRIMYKCTLNLCGKITSKPKLPNSDSNSDFNSNSNSSPSPTPNPNPNPKPQSQPQCIRSILPLIRSTNLESKLAQSGIHSLLHTHTLSRFKILPNHLIEKLFLHPRFHTTLATNYCKSGNRQRVAVDAWEWTEGGKGKC